MKTSVDKFDKQKTIDELKGLIEEHAIFKKDYIMPNGSIADTYCDVREILLSAEGLSLAASAVYNLLKPQAKYIGGSLLSSYALPSCISLLSKQNENGSQLDSFFVRKNARQIGHSRWIEGPLKVNSKVALVVDMLENPTDLIEIVRRLESEAKAEVVQVIAILDIDRNNYKRLKEQNIHYQTLIYLDEFVKDDNNA